MATKKHIGRPALIAERVDSPLPASQINAAPSELHDLRNAVNLMDALSQEGFSEIIAIAGLARRSLETTDGCRHLDDIVGALNVICDKACDIQNSINCSAADVGCNYVDEAARRRVDARCAARKQTAAYA